MANNTPPMTAAEREALETRIADFIETDDPWDIAKWLLSWIKESDLPLVWEELARNNGIDPTTPPHDEASPEDQEGHAHTT